MYKSSRCTYPLNIILLCIIKCDFKHSREEVGISSSGLIDVLILPPNTKYLKSCRYIPFYLALFFLRRSSLIFMSISCSKPYSIHLRLLLLFFVINQSSPFQKVFSHSLLPMTSRVFQYTVFLPRVFCPRQSPLWL